MSSAEGNHSRVLMSRGVVHACAAARAGRGAWSMVLASSACRPAWFAAMYPVGECRPLVEFEDEHLAGQERPVQGRVGHPVGAESGLDRGPAHEVDQHVGGCVWVTCRSRTLPRAA